MVQDFTVDEYISQGKVLLVSGDSSSAKDYFKKALQLEPMSVESYIHLGICQASMDEYDEAEKTFNKALMIEKDQMDAFFHLGNINFIKENVPKGIECFNRAIQLGYPGGLIHHNLGLVYEDMDDLEVALKHYVRAVKVDPLVPEFHLKVATTYYGLDDQANALKALDEMMLYNPDVFESYALKFEILMRKGDIESAQQVVDLALSMYPSDVSFHFYQARILIQQNKLEQALQLLSDIESMEGFEVEAMNINLEKAKIHLEMNQVDLGIAHLEKMKEYEQEGLHYEGRYYLINLFMSLGRMEEALSNIEELLEQPNESIFTTSCYYYRAFCINKLRSDEGANAYKEAQTRLRSLTLKNPLDIETFIFRILAHKDMKEYSQAIELVDYLLKITDSTAELYILKQKIYEDKGDKEEADRQLQMALAIDPEVVSKMENTYQM